VLPGVRVEVAAHRVESGCEQRRAAVIQHDARISAHIPASGGRSIQALDFLGRQGEVVAPPFVVAQIEPGIEGALREPLSGVVEPRSGRGSTTGPISLHLAFAKALCCPGAPRLGQTVAPRRASVWILAPCLARFVLG
jgi:hypothetical protein